MDKAAFGNQSGCYRNSKESFCLDPESCFHDICLLFPKFYDDIWRSMQNDTGNTAKHMLFYKMRVGTAGKVFRIGLGSVCGFSNVD